MGWSCTADAMRVMDRWSTACRNSTGSSNTWREDCCTEKFFEASNREHDDGAITGTIWLMLPGGMARRSGTFRIDGDGKVVRAPKWLKDRS